MEDKKPRITFRTIIFGLFALFVIALIIIGVILLLQIGRIEGPRTPGTAIDSEGRLTVTPEEDKETILAGPLFGSFENDVNTNWWPWSNLYLREKAACTKDNQLTECVPLNWATINPQAGVYDFSSLDLLIKNAKDRKKYVVVRLLNTLASDQETTLPSWVKSAGVTTSTSTAADSGLAGIEVDYYKCSFLDLWDDLVSEVISRYQNEATLIGIDIGSYGYNGSWVSSKTVASEGPNDPNDPTAAQSADTRARIIRMFTGGKGSGKCVAVDGSEKTESYDYPGFKGKSVFINAVTPAEVELATQAGAGVRFDSLDNNVTNWVKLRESFGGQLSSVWQTKPILADLVPNFEVTDASVNQIICLAQQFHFSSVKHNFTDKPGSAYEKLLKQIGPRIVLTKAIMPSKLQAGSEVEFDFSWVNKGTSPVYGKYPLTLFFKSRGQNSVALSISLTSTDVAKILPAELAQKPDNFQGCSLADPQVVETIEKFTAPTSLPNGEYDVYLGFMDANYNQPIPIALSRKDSSGRYLLSTIEITGSVAANLPNQVCGDGQVQAPNSDGINEICDDGNTSNGDRCSSDCRNSCASGETWNGTRCVGAISSQPTTPTEDVTYSCVNNQCVEVTDGSGSTLPICQSSCGQSSNLCGNNICDDSENGNSCSSDCSTTCNDNLDNDNDNVRDEQEASCHTDGNANNESSYNPNLTEESAPVASEPTPTEPEPPVVTPPPTTPDPVPELPKTAIEDDMRVLISSAILLLIGFLGYKYHLGMDIIDRYFPRVEFGEKVMKSQERKRK